MAAIPNALAWRQNACASFHRLAVALRISLVAHARKDNSLGAAIDGEGPPIAAFFHLLRAIAQAC